MEFMVKAVSICLALNILMNVIANVDCGKYRPGKLVHNNIFIRCEV